MLETLEEAFGFEHAMVLLPDETGQRLYAIASRGYGEAGIGAEVGMGEGLIGTVARERCVLRVAGVGSELPLRPRHPRERAPRGGREDALPEIPLPGLVDAQCQLALPLVAGNRLVGVIAVESTSPGMFEEWHEAYLEIIAGQVASAIENMIRRERDAEEEASREAPKAAGPALPCAEERVRRFRFFRGDDCVFVDDGLIPEPPGSHPLEAAPGPRDDRAHRLHEPRATAGPRARPARDPGQPREPPRAPPEAPAAEVPGRRPGPLRARALPPRDRMPLRARGSGRGAPLRTSSIG